MSIAYTAARLLLGLAIVAAGVSVFFRSHWVLFVAAMQCLSGALLIANRFVPLALTIAGAILFNIVAYHATIMPAGLPAAAVAVGLWVLIAQRHRANFKPLLA